MNEIKLSAGKTMRHVLLYFLLFLAGDLLSSLVFDGLFLAVPMPAEEWYVILRMLGSFALTYAFFWLYTRKVLRRELADFGVTAAVKPWGVLFAVGLPGLVAAVFACVGEGSVKAFPVEKTVLVLLASLLIAVKSGILEEMLFRGFIMKLLEARWGRTVAILAPSLVFALLHVSSMTTFDLGGFLLLLVGGTSVGVMFSLVAYKGKSIANSALLHAVWNFVMITDVLHITTAQGAYGAPLASILIPEEPMLLTGGAFGVEVSVVAIVGYWIVCGLTMLGRKKAR